MWRPPCIWCPVSKIVGHMASASCYVDTAICMQAAAAKQVRVTLQSKAGTKLPPTPPHASHASPSPTSPPTATGIWALRHLQGRCCLPLTAQTHTVPTTISLAHTCPCLCPAAHTFIVTNAFFHGSFYIFTSVPICPYLSHLSLHGYIYLYLSPLIHIYSYLPLPTHTCSHIFLQAHASSQKVILAHTRLYLHTSAHTCFPLPMTACTSHA